MKVLDVAELNNAEIDGNVITIIDTKGDVCIIRCFKTIPLEINSIKAIDKNNG